MRLAPTLLSGMLIAGLAVSTPAQTVPGPATPAANPPPWPQIYRLRIVAATEAGGVRMGIGGGFELVEAAVRRRRGGKPVVHRFPRGRRAALRGFPRRPLRLRAPGTAVFLLAVARTAPGRLEMTTSAPRGVAIRVDNRNARGGHRIASRYLTGRDRLRIGAADVVDGGPVPGTEPLSPEVYAFYYQWYGMHHWADGSVAPHNLNPDPYDSGDVAAIDRHIAQAQAAGIDGLVVSWLGTDTGSDANLQKLVSRLPPGFRFAPYIEIHYAAFLTMESLVDQLDHVLDTYATHPGYIRYEGRPTIWIWSALHVFKDHFEPWNPEYLDVFRDVLAELRRRGHDPVLVGEGRPFTPRDYDVFTGMHMYMTDTEEMSYRVNERLSLVARAYAAVHGGHRRIFGATPFPGYDDRHIGGRPGNYHLPREDGALYRRQWASATEVGADQAMVVSFNEWFETTNIEPNATWGDGYLTLTRELSDAFRASRP